MSFDYIINLNSPFLSECPNRKLDPRLLIYCLVSCLLLLFSFFVVLTAAGLDFGRTHSSFTARKGTLSGLEIALGDQKWSDDVPRGRFVSVHPDSCRYPEIGHHITYEANRRTSSFAVSSVDICAAICMLRKFTILPTAITGQCE